MIKRDPIDLASSLQKLGGQQQNRVIELDIHQNREASLEKLKALASEPRLRILEYLTNPHKLSNLTEIANELSMNLATVTMHINILEDAGLIICDHIPGERGTQRVCGCFCNWINIHTTPKLEADRGKFLDYNMPIGAYFDFKITATCGMFSEHTQIGRYDDPNVFYDTKRTQAQLLWFHSGYLEYRFPNQIDASMQIENLSLSMELCSEAPGIHDDWPSDISIWINDKEIGTWTSPGDFGGVRGRLTPSWHPTSNTQYGFLKTWQVSQKGTQLDGSMLSNISLSKLELAEKDFISVKIGVKETAEHVGGINLFGSKFGNHPQDIKLSIHYQQTN